MKINLTPLAYRLLKMEKPEPPAQSLVITQRDRLPCDTPCCGGEDFNRFQTRYQGIQEHLIQANDHD